MDPNVLHLIVAAVSTLAFAVVTALIWKRGQVKTVFWWIGLTLLPFGLYLLGLAPALQGAVETLTAWATGLTFTPLVWTGVVLAGLSALLMLGSRLIPSESFADRRAARKAAAKQPQTASGRPSSRPAAAASDRRAVTSSRPAPSRTPQASPKPAQASGSSQDAEFDEIADILRKRGIN